MRRAKRLYTDKPFWIVWYGVDSRHLTESVGVFNTLREANEAYESLELESPFQAKRLNRVTEQPHTIRVIKEVLR